MYIIFTSTFTLLFVVAYAQKSRRRSSSPVILTTYEDIHALLNPPATSISTLLHRRAMPNARLIGTFALHNSTFTNASDGVHRTFNKHIVERLRAIDSPNKWQDSRGVIQDAIEFYLPNGSASGDYAMFMQAVVFVTVLAIFFGCTSSFPDPNNVHFVTKGINALWMASKSPTVHPSENSSTLSRINQYLRDWIPPDTTNPFIDNPLEIILPAYETLWRLVAHTFNYVEGSNAHTSPFLDFFHNPTSVQFQFSRDSHTPSAHDIVQEVLRIHPPTKRIKRTSGITPLSLFSSAHRYLFAPIPHPTLDGCKVVAADIEALQQSSVWDPLPHDFDAMRHKTSTQVQKQCLMPFGLGPLKCVAASWAPRFAGMLIAGLVKRDDVELVRGKTLGGRAGWEGWKIGRRE